MNQQNPFAKRLTRARAKLKKLQEQQQKQSASALPGSYVTGSSGQSASYRRKLEKQLDRTIDLAVKIVDASQQVNRLQAKYDAYEAGTIDAQGRAKPVSTKTKHAEQKQMTPQERLFKGNFPTGIIYADRGRTKHSDYARVAYLNYKTLILEWDDDAHKSPPELRALIETDAADIQARRGERYPYAQSYVILGE